LATYTTTDFLTAVRRRGSIPTTTNTNNINSTSNLLELASEELHIKLVPLIMSVRNEYYVNTQDYSITASQSGYRIPARGIGQVLRDLLLVRNNGLISLPPIERDVVASTDTGTPDSYYLEHDKVMLVPTPGTTVDTLRMIYYLRPGRLAAESDCAKVSSIDSATDVTVASIPSTWTAGTEIDFVDALSPYKYHTIDQSISSVASTTITMASLPSDLAVGDWLAPAGYSPIPQVPTELLPVLVQMTVIKALEALGDEKGATLAWKDLQTIQDNALSLITPRNHSEPRKVIGRNWSRKQFLGQ